MNHLYTTRHSGLFFYFDAGYYSAEIAEITAIDWNNQSTVDRCQYCGHDYTGEECPGCAARRKDKVLPTGVAKVCLRGYAHPHNAWMMSLPRHIELHYARCGRMDDYDNWDWCICFEDCETLDKQVINPNSFGNDEPVMFSVKFQANTLIQYENPRRENG